jgi:hypothetical protein
MALFSRKTEAAREHAQALADHNRYDTKTTLAKARETGARVEALGVSYDEVGAQSEKLRGQV